MGDPRSLTSATYCWILTTSNASSVAYRNVIAKFHETRPSELCHIQVALANDKTLPQACKEASISIQSYYRWRKEISFHTARSHLAPCTNKVEVNLFLQRKHERRNAVLA